MSELNREWCIEQDKQDSLRSHRAAFDIPEGVIYMDGNSLGPLPVGVHDHIGEVVSKEWGRDLIKSWNTADWVNLPQRVGAKIAPLIGAQPNEVVMADSTSINLFKVAAAACKLQKGRYQILSEPGNFPTDLYMMQGLTDFLGGEYHLKTIERGEIANAITDETAIVLLTQVHYVTADMLDMAAITRAAHDKGALIIWDLSHSAGAVPVDLNGANADFAVGCGYKYLNGGPGAPAFLYVAERLQNDLQQPLSGWFGHKAPFDFVDDYTPADGIKRMLVGTTGVLAGSALECALGVFQGVEMRSLRRKSVALTDLFIGLAEEHLSEFGVGIVTPKDGRKRGSHVSLAHPEGYAIMQAVIDHGVIGDFRAPNFMRFGITPLYLGYEDVFDAIATIRDVLASGIFNDPKYKAKSAVT